MPKPEGNPDISKLGEATRFSKDNQPNNKGRKPSIKAEVAKLLESDGKTTIKKENVVRVNEDGSVVIKVPKKELLAIKVLDWAMSNSGNNSLKAIQMVMEQFDGKPKQALSVEGAEDILPTEYSVIPPPPKKP